MREPVEPRHGSQCNHGMARERASLRGETSLPRLAASSDAHFTTAQLFSLLSLVPAPSRNELVVALADAAPTTLVRRKARGDRGPAPPAMPRAAWSGSPFPRRAPAAAAPPASDPSGSYLESL